MSTKQFMLILCIFSIHAPLFAEENADSNKAYITDDLKAFVRSGPTRNYRIIDALDSETPVIVIGKDEDNKATHIRLPSGKEGWIDNSKLIEQPGAKTQLANLNIRWQEAQQQIEQLKQEVAASQELQSKNKNLTGQNIALEQELSALQQQNQWLSEKKSTSMLYAGGIILGVGFLLGWLFSAMAQRRKNKWF